MRKLFTAVAICFTVFFVSCDHPHPTANNDGETITTLTIRNESAHEITHVIWNNAFFTSGTNSISPGTSVTMDVQAGIGFLRFRPRSNSLSLRTQLPITVAERTQTEFRIINSTIAVREGNDTADTLGVIAAEAAPFINWQPTLVGSDHNRH